ncbi:dihydroorotate dehydrogenase (quinone) [Synchytrium microbalum]|uniref:Dihydroorotate dehydrogenase (quinone), mitochondrial n=1 Tax=Synchytrium microbalum TaxID=1806994 RepID=A0A507C483_9FUNG|nr:dihydroorotate dehydrogenase (quinone) [Synchytrium microbalum]TPX34472.1 dihydroorotate dehydrogenase (quinone) [Synchytrium microbalum]
MHAILRGRILGVACQSSKHLLSSPTPINPRTALQPIIKASRRHQSTSSGAPDLSSITTPLRYAAFIIAGTFFISYSLDPRANIHKHVWMPIIHFAIPDAEDSHKLAIWLAHHGISPRDTKADHPSLSTSLFGKKMLVSNPIGLAAGFDKNGEAIDGMLNLGFGMVEIGSVTPLPQNGNAKPRMFRLPNDQAVINRYGFNSEGMLAVIEHLRARMRWYRHPKSDTSVPKSLRPGHLLGINLGKNKLSPADSNQDYIDGVQQLGQYADYLVVNVSSPNTPGLRALQKREILETLLSDVKKARDDSFSKQGPPILVKIAPDLSDEEVQDVADCIKKVGIDGVIISNTTISRPGSLKSPRQLVNEQGGLSGAPVQPLALSMVKKMYKLLPKDIPIIGCGGISTADDAIKFAKAGASAVQTYTSLGYQGPGLVASIKDDLVAKLDGKKWSDIVGIDHQTIE